MVVTSNPGTVRTVHKAEGLGGHVVPDARINITAKMPSDQHLREVDGTLSIYRTDADSVMFALRSLPQVTRHQLLILMLQDRAEHYMGA